MEHWILRIDPAPAASSGRHRHSVRLVRQRVPGELGAATVAVLACEALVRAHFLTQAAELTVAAGGTVEVCRLVGTPEHNGKQGHVLSWAAEKGRWSVRLAAGQTLGLKPANMRPTAAPADAGCTAADLWAVFALAHCGGTNRAWRAAALRPLVVLLSPPASPWTRAAAARGLLGYVDESEGKGAERVLAANAVVPLLAMFQAVVRGVDLAPVPEKANGDAMLAMADGGGLALMKLCGVAEARLLDHGWEIEDSAESGRIFYSHQETQERQEENPLLAAENGAYLHVGWQAALLQKLPQLISPRWDSAASAVRWPCSIRRHAPGAAACGLSDLTVLDELANADGEETVIRQLVLGGWQGVDGFRESEFDVAEPAGSELYSWYTTALAAAAALATGGSGRLLLVGLGGGSVVAFLRRHYPALLLEAIEISPEVVAAAADFFGVDLVVAPSAACAATPLVPPSSPSVEPPPPMGEVAWGLFDSDSGSGSDEQSEAPQLTPAPEPFLDGGPTLVHQCDARAFVRARLEAVAAAETAVVAVGLQFDAILLDVYTQGVFPPALLDPRFIVGLRRLLAPGGAGLLAANVGGAGVADGGHAEVLVGLAGQWPEVTMLIEDTADAATADRGTDNVVLVGSCALPEGAAFSIAGWETTLQRAAVHAAGRVPLPPVVPFEVSSALPSEPPTQVGVLPAVVTVRLGFSEAGSNKS
jgi:hypothetical protein